MAVIHISWTENLINKYKNIKINMKIDEILTKTVFGD